MAGFGTRTCLVGLTVATTVFLGCRMERRDFQSPEYKRWRAAVYRRDRWKCRMPGCQGGDKRLNAHHIKCWTTFPTLRFVVSNGITLCRLCHETIRGRETEFESTFTSLLAAPRSNAALLVLMKKYDRSQEKPEE